jgi:hypothetical protein
MSVFQGKGRTEKAEINQSWRETGEMENNEHGALNPIYHLSFQSLLKNTGPQQFLLYQISFNLKFKNL